MLVTRTVKRLRVLCSMNFVRLRGAENTESCKSKGVEENRHEIKDVEVLCCSV